MGSKSYGFLIDSIFFDEKSLNNKFKNETIERLAKELDDYREYCLSNYGELVAQIKGSDNPLRVTSSKAYTSIQRLKQTALYLDQFIIDDPLFKLSDPPNQSSHAFSKYLGYEPSRLDKESIFKAASFMWSLTPMIVADYVKPFPLSYYFERGPEIPLYYPINNNEDLLPKPLRDFFWENTVINTLIKNEEKGYMVVNKPLEPCRGIFIDFKGAEFDGSMGYHLFQTEYLPNPDEPGKYTVRQFMPDTPPEKEEFEAWVIQSVNKAAKNYHDQIFAETAISASLDSNYLCQNPFASKLLDQSLKHEDESISSFTANQVLNLELPFLEKIDTQKLMDIRLHEQDIFTNFRIELERNFRELRNETDPKTLEMKTQNIWHELNQVQLAKIKSKIENIKQQSSVNLALGIGGLASTIATSGLSLFATALAAGKGYKSYLEYQEKVKENPSYLLWRVQK